MARRNLQYILLVLTCLTLAFAGKPTSFCKCTCFTNSTIIPLDAPDPSTTNKPASDNDASKHHGRTCTDCTKQFCLDYNLPICTNAKDDDVFTTCFQRDSTKDELVVFIFIFATVGLLLFALVKPYVLKWRESREGVQRGQYAPVSGAGGR